MYRITKRITKIDPVADKLGQQWRQRRGSEDSTFKKMRQVIVDIVIICASGTTDVFIGIMSILYYT